MTSNVRTHCTVDCHTILSQVCPRDTAPTWRQREMDNLRAPHSVGDISRKTAKSTPNFRHSIGFQTFILRNPAAFTTLLPARACDPRYRPIYSVGCIPLATALPLAGRWHKCNELLPSTPRTPSLPILKKLTTSDATVGIQLKTGCDSTIFHALASRSLSPTGLPTKTHSTILAANKVAVLKATTDASPGDHQVDGRGAPSTTWRTH